MLRVRKSELGAKQSGNLYEKNRAGNCCQAAVGVEKTKLL
jgi:hypothetical protein